MKNKKRTSPIWAISKENLIRLVEESQTLSEVLRYFGLKNRGSNYKTIKKRFEEDGIDDSKFKNNFGKGSFGAKIPLKDILVKGSNYNRTNLKKRLLKSGFIENFCSECGLSGEWNEKPIVMVLDHINGVNDDNRIDNLRMLCPNCNSQQSTFAGRKLKTIKNCPDCGIKIRKSSNKCTNCYARDTRKVERPSKEKLQKLLWSKPTTKVAKSYGVSDNAVAKWAKSYGLDKPSRGYWQKIEKNNAQ